MSDVECHGPQDGIKSARVTGLNFQREKKKESGPLSLAGNGAEHGEPLDFFFLSLLLNG